MTGKLGVGEDSMTTMVMCARTPFFLTTFNYISLSAPHINTQHVIDFHLYTKGGSGASGF